MNKKGNSLHIVNVFLVILGIICAYHIYKLNISNNNESTLIGELKNNINIFDKLKFEFEGEDLKSRYLNRYLNIVEISRVVDLEKINSSQLKVLTEIFNLYNDSSNSPIEIYKTLFKRNDGDSLVFVRFAIFYVNSLNNSSMKNISKVYEKYPETIFPIAKRFEQENKLKEAENFYKLSIQKKKNEILSHLMLAKIYGDKNYFESLNHLENVLKLDSTNINAYSMLSSIYLSRNKFENAKTILKIAYKRKITNSIISYNWGIINENAGDIKNAEYYFVHAYNQNNSDTLIIKKLAEFYEKNKIDLSLNYYKKLNQISNKNINLLKKIVKIEYPLNRVDSLFKYLNKLNKLDTLDYETNYLLGEIYKKQYQKYDLSEKCYSKALSCVNKRKHVGEIDTSIKEIDIYLSYCDLLVNYMAQYKKADEYFKMLITNYKDIDTDDIELYRNFLVNKLNYSSFNSIIEIINTISENHYELKHVLSEYYEKALKYKPNNYNFHFQLGLLLEREDAKSAKKHLKKAIKLKPENINPYYTLLEIYIKNQDSVNINKCCKEILKIDSTSVRAYAILAFLNGFESQQGPDDNPDWDTTSLGYKYFNKACSVSISDDSLIYYQLIPDYGLW